jgi:hypothetical protein
LANTSSTSGGWTSVPYAGQLRTTRSIWGK